MDYTFLKRNKVTISSSPKILKPCIYKKEYFSEVYSAKSTQASNTEFYFTENGLSSNSASIKWTNNLKEDALLKVQHISCNLYETKSDGTLEEDKGKRKRIPSQTNEVEFRQLTPGTDYTFIMKKISLADKIVSKTSFTFRTVFNLSEMICLKEKALLFAKKKVDSFQEINFLYRFKSKNYFENVYFHNEGSPLPKHKKDKTGHFANPTIDHIRGVFFAGTVNKFNEMPEKSPFGDTRFEVEVHKMLNPEKSNIYFSDFYCVRSDYAKRNHLLSNFTETGHRHYITLVVTDKNSYENDFCSRYFEKIDLINGPNLRIIKQLDGNYKYYWNTNSAIATEIFYTPTMSMADGKFKRDCKPLAKGCSTANGIGHAKRCTICNN